MNSSYQKDFKMNRHMGSVIKVIRIANDLTISELSKISKVSVSYIHELELGRKTPSINIIKKISQALNIPAYIVCTIDEYGKTCDYHYQKMLIKTLEYYCEGGK